MRYNVGKYYNALLKKVSFFTNMDLSIKGNERVLVKLYLSCYKKSCVIFERFSFVEGKNRKYGEKDR